MSLTSEGSEGQAGGSEAGWSPGAEGCYSGAGWGGGGSGGKVWGERVVQ